MSANCHTIVSKHLLISLYVIKERFIIKNQPWPLESLINTIMYMLCCFDEVGYVRDIAFSQNIQNHTYLQGLTIKSSIAYKWSFVYWLIGWPKLDNLGVWKLQGRALVVKLYEITETREELAYNRKVSILMAILFYHFFDVCIRFIKITVLDCFMFELMSSWSIWRQIYKPRFLNSMTSVTDYCVYLSHGPTNAGVCFISHL